MSAALDHLVIAARTLDEGTRWCETTLGITPGPGGKHALMGTHNRLFALGSRAYAEIIAIDPEAPPPDRSRWFDLDNEALRRSIAKAPRLVHWVVRVQDLGAAAAVYASRRVDPGRMLDASRRTPEGELRWRICVRDDGTRPMRGALPTLIEWGPVHPADSMPPSGVELLSLSVGGGDAQKLADALAALGMRGIALRADGPPVEALLATPLGQLRLTIEA